MDLDGEPNAIGRKLIVTNCPEVRTAPIACILLSLI